MEDTEDLVKLAGQEMASISQELDLQGEKLAGIQQKLGEHREAIFKTRFSVESLRNATAVKRYLLALGVLGVLFATGVLAIYALKPPGKRHKIE